MERQGLRRASGLLAAAAALGMAVTILSPAFMRHAAPFLFAPWNVRAASPYAIEVDPGNATVARGGSQPVTARLKGFESETVELGVRSGPTGDWKRWPMTTEPGMDGFRFVLFALDAPTDYFVEAAGCAPRPSISTWPTSRTSSGWTSNTASPPTPASRRRRSRTPATWPRSRERRSSSTSPRP